MTKIILHMSADKVGTDTVDLSFTLRSHSAAKKWVKCLNEIGDRVPFNYAYSVKVKDLPEISARINETISNSPDLLEFLAGQDLTISYELVNSIHRYIELHKNLAHIYLQLHNDIHLWEGLTKDMAFSEDERATWNVPWKIMWNPPATNIPFDLVDYLQYGTERVGNFLMIDYAHVGRDPFNSYKFRDDRSLETSCLIQHAVTSGFYWIKQDDSGNFIREEANFRAWVKEKMWFFSQSGIVDEYDPRLCFGRMIVADGDKDYTQLDAKYEYVLKVSVAD